MDIWGILQPLYNRLFDVMPPPIIWIFTIHDPDIASPEITPILINMSYKYKFIYQATNYDYVLAIAVIVLHEILIRIVMLIHRRKGACCHRHINFLN